MPDFEDKIPISEFSYTNTLHNTDQAPIIQQDGADWDNFRTSMADIGLHINKDMEYVTDLHTTSKKIIGAINELADGGSSMDITTEIDTPASVQTFSDGGDNIPVKSLITEITATQAGTGTPSPSNVRPITGVDTIDVNVCGKNILDSSIGVRNYTSPYTFFRFGGTSADSVDGSLYLAKGTYTFSISTTAYVIRALDKDNQSIEFVNNDNKLTFTLTESQKCMITIAVSGNVQLSDFTYQLELNDEATTYEAYKGTTHTITLPETIYGGSLDVSKGEGIEEYGVADLSLLNWAYSSSGSGTFRSTDLAGILQPVSTSEVPDFLCEVFLAKTGNNVLSGIDGIACNSSGNIWVHYGNMTSVSDFITAISGAKLVYKKLTSTTFNTTPEQITTLSGTNNIYADCGDIQSLEYFNDKADDIASMVRLMTRT